MSWSPLQLCGISFNSSYKSPALLEFQRGLNVIRGASDTGKSFLVEAIDFLLGAKVTKEKNPLRDIPERDGYDRTRLVLRAREDELFTIQRNTVGGNLSRFEGSWLSNEPDVEARNLAAVHAHGDRKTLSTYLLSLIGLEDKYVQKNQRGETQSLSFRNLLRLAVVQENDITKQISPILSGRHTETTVEYSVFKLLLTGVDASALAEQATRHNEIATTRQNNRAKIEFIEELIQELQTTLNGLEINRIQAEEQISQLEEQSERQQATLNHVQRDLNSRIERRREVLGRIESWIDRSNEITSLLSRFELLKEHYRIDLERLASIEESGSLFVHLERTPCPLCGALPNEQHIDEVCDGDVESVVNAATAEMAKVQQLSEELDQTSEDLTIEAEELTNQREQLEPELQILNQEIQEISSPLRDAQNTFSELIKQCAEMQRIIDVFSRIEQMQQKKASLLAEINELPSTVSSRVDLSASVLDDFAKTVQNLLQAWGFPGSDRVSFDETKKDLIIGGQPRTSRGKGLRAVTHAAMTIGLMDFCKDRNLSHPGFVVLDSPLLAYWKPEASEEKVILEGVELKERFYEYLANNYNDSQIIIIENEHPPANFEEKITLTNFTKNSNKGRYGFFPLVEN
jgi:AAA domain